jgi:hypothetical protein
MRSVDLAVSVVAVAIAGCARTGESRGIPPGAYTTEMGPSDLPDSLPPTDRDGMTGTWTLHFSPGRVAVDFKGSRVVEAPIQVSGDRVTFDSAGTGSSACHLPGTYTYTVGNGALRFKRVSDQCDGRAAVLTTHPLRTKSP